MKKTHLLLMLALCATLLASCSAGEPDATQTQRLYLTAAPGTALAEGGQAELTLWVEDLGDGTRAHVDTVFHGRSEK